MAIIELPSTDTNIGLYMKKAKSALDLRKPMWKKMTDEQRKAWVLNDNDPVMGIAYTMYKYLYQFFGETS